MYATLEDLKKQLPEDVLISLSDDAGAGSIDTTVTDTAIEAAGVEIDGYLGGRYALPFDPVPAILTKQAVDIACYNLYARRNGPTEFWQKRYDNVVRFLVMVAGGKISLGVDDPATTGGQDEAVITSSDRIFTRATLGGY